MASAPLSDALRDTLAVFDCGEPRTTTEVAGSLEVGRRSTYARLEQLVEHGKLETKKVGANARVWWRPSPESGTTESEKSRLERQAELLERYVNIVEAIGEPVYELDDRGRLTFVNDAFVEYSGYERSELLGQHVSLGMDEEAISRAQSRIEELLKNDDEDSAVIEYDVIRKSGERIPVENHFTLLTDEEGRMQGSAGMLRDVSERRAYERELKRYESLVRESRDTSAIVDPDGTFQYVTPSVETEFGYDPAELLGEDVLGYVHPEDREYVAEMFAELVDDPDDELTVEYRFERADGSWAAIESRARNLLDEPLIEGILVYSWEISEHRTREQELRSAKAKLEAATQAGAVGTWEWDVAENRLSLEAWFAELFGLTPEASHEGIPLQQFLSRIHEDDRDRVQAQIGAAVLSCGPYEAEYRLWNADDELRWVVARGQVECDENGDPVNFPGALVDITDRKQAEMELERQRAQLTVVNSIHEVVTEITEAVIAQSTREEIEATVCEHLAASESYLLAWIGDVDSTTQTVQVRTEAGVEGYLDGITVSVDPDDPRSQGPVGQAFLSGEMQTTYDAETTLRHEPWREHASEYGFRSSVSIPVVYDGSTYGVLNVYAERSRAFEGREGELLARLGEIVGHAIAATEHKRALSSDELVELEFQMRDAFDVMGLSGEPAGTIRLDHAVALGDDEFLVYGTATRDCLDTVTELVEISNHWQEVAVRSHGDPAGFELRMQDPPILSVVTSLGGYIDSAVLDEGMVRMTVHLPPGTDVRQVIDAVEETYPHAEMLRRRQIGRPQNELHPVRHQVAEELTDRQRAVLDVAYHAGFFEWPRESDGTELAKSLDIAPPTFHQHLRKAERKVFDAVFSSGTLPSE